MRPLAISAGATALMLRCVAAFAQPFQPQTTPPPDYAKTVIRTTDLGHRTYMLEGEGGNIVVAAGEDGLIMVDDEYAPLHEKITAAIAAISGEPVRYLVLTHFHRDHTGGNAAFAQEGAIIVAHESVRGHLAAGTHNGVTGNAVAPAPGIVLPKETYANSMMVQVRGRSAQLFHIANAHTDGDTVVYFPDANVLATGDIITFGRYPNIDYLYGGSIDGMIDGVNAVLRLTTDDTKIVPGHGPLGTRAMILDYRKMLTTIRARLRSLIAAGKTEDEVVAAKPNADYDAKLHVSRQAAGNFIRVVYRSLKKIDGSALLRCMDTQMRDLAMENVISNLLSRYEKGSLSRRELVSGLAMLAAGGTATAAQDEVNFKDANIDHISIHVADLNRSIDFYQKMFGFSVVSRADPEIVRLGNGKTLVSLNHGRPAGTIDHFAIGIPRFNAETAARYVAQRGATPLQGDYAGFHVKDPDGINVQISRS